MLCNDYAYRYMCTHTHNLCIYTHTQVCGKLTLASKSWTAGDPFISNMYNATFGRLNSQDQDLEVQLILLILLL